MYLFWYGKHSHKQKNSSLSLSPLNQAKGCHWQHRVSLRGVIDTAESDSAVSMIQSNNVQVKRTVDYSKTHVIVIRHNDGMQKGKECAETALVFMPALLLLVLKDVLCFWRILLIFQ